MYSVKYNFIMLRNEMESYVRIGGEGFEKSYVPLHRGGGGGVRNCQNHPYVINEWLQSWGTMIIALQKYRKSQCFKIATIKISCLYISKY